MMLLEGAGTELATGENTLCTRGISNGLLSCKAVLSVKDGSIECVSWMENAGWDGIAWLEVWRGGIRLGGLVCGCAGVLAVLVSLWHNPLQPQATN